MTAYLHRVNSVEEAPEREICLLYNLEGGTYYIERKNYNDFSHYWSRQGKFEPVVMDLASTDSHCVILDLDFRTVDGQKSNNPPYKQIFPLIQSTLKMLLLPHTKHFTYILAARSDGPGLHVHLPECIIGHDDYILLCQQLATPLKCELAGKGTYTLDILKNVTLAGAAKPHQRPYKAIQMIYIDEKNTFALDLQNCSMASQLPRLKKVFKRVKDNEGSVFRYLLFLEEIQAQQHVLQYMMPIATPHPPLYKLAFATTISNIPNETTDAEDVATFTKRQSKDVGYISKGKHLTLARVHFLKAFHYLRHNTFLISTFETNNYALKTWYERIKRTSPINSHTNPIFDKINQFLKEKNNRLMDDVNPIKTIMEFDQGYYFLPVFYALCNVIPVSPVTLIHNLSAVVDRRFAPLLARLEQVEEIHIQSIVQNLTEQTILFCGNNMCHRFDLFRNKLKQIVNDAKRGILSCSTAKDLTELIRSLQECHFPIRVLRFSNAIRKSSPFIWNSLTQSWQEIQVEREKDSHMTNLWNAIKNWLLDYKKAGNFGGPDDDIIKSFNIQTVMSMITSDSSMERKNVQMDRHKWFIRTNDALLDILTGHIGGTVPQLFLSDRKLGIELNREELDKLYNHSKELEQLYELLTDKSFFQKYLKALFTDQTDDLFDTLNEIIRERLPDLLGNTYALSMMHFFVDMCKYSAFEHDLLMYLLDVLSSVFIATNYEKKFFVCKGDKSNGKSKLFEILRRVFGSYYHCIQADNLKPGGNSSTNASPDLASTLFNCRIVTTEELEGKLDENRVKQITGNSCVVFRNMYEASQGGIPTAKLFTTTNNVPDCRSTEAFVDRTVAIPFASRFVDKAPDTTAEQVRLSRYGKDEFVIEKCYMGCFLMLSYNLKKFMDVKDGLLKCRDPPPSVVEYTRLYLFNTDVYNQFKTNMDVQPCPDSMTTMTDLRSAIRQFLKTTKNNTTPETELILKFEEEFSEYRRSDMQLGSMQYTSILEPSSSLVVENTMLLEEEEEEDTVVLGKRSAEEEPSGSKKKKAKTQEDTVLGKRPGERKENGPRKKKPKIAVPDVVVYYENVIIRNMTRRHEN